MDDKLTKWSYIVFLGSFFLLFGLFYFYSPEEMLIEDLSNLESQEYFKVRGKVIKVKDYEKVAYIKIMRECDAELMIFKSDNRSFAEAEGQRILGEGHVLEKGTYVLDSFRID